MFIKYLNTYKIKIPTNKYAREIKDQGLPSKFVGKNFVFDERLGERITDDVISECHQCGAKCDNHVNCKNDDCHLLFIQCAACAEKFDGCCTPRCMEISHLPIEEQRKLRKGKRKEDTLSVYRSRLRPDLRQILGTGDGWRGAGETRANQRNHRLKRSLDFATTGSSGLRIGAFNCREWCYSQPHCRPDLC